MLKYIITWIIAFMIGCAIGAAFNTETAGATGCIIAFIVTLGASCNS